MLVLVSSTNVFALKRNQIVCILHFSATEAPHKESLSQKSEEAGSALPLTPGRQIEDDAEVVRRAREEGRVNVVFPGSVTQEGCCRIICEILKCILYQRQQLPMTYEQLVYSQKEHQDMLVSVVTLLSNKQKHPLNVS